LQKYNSTDAVTLLQKYIQSEIDCRKILVYHYTYHPHNYYYLFLFCLTVLLVLHLQSCCKLGEQHRLLITMVLTEQPDFV